MPSPIITLDGPSGCGKSTVSRLLALRYDWALLDSGALYRILAWRSLELGKVDLAALAGFFKEHKIAFEPCDAGQQTHIIIDGQTLDPSTIRDPEIGAEASRLSTREDIRALLVDLQRAYANVENGLIAEGRDMGSVIFPEAVLKIYMTADSKIRNERRFNQLQAMGQSVSIEGLRAKMEARDERDQSRKHAPLVAAKDAIVLDTTEMSIEDVLEAIDQAYQEKQALLS